MFDFHKSVVSFSSKTVYRQSIDEETTISWLEWCVLGECLGVFEEFVEGVLWVLHKHDSGFSEFSWGGERIRRQCSMQSWWMLLLCLGRFCEEDNWCWPVIFSRFCSHAYLGPLHCFRDRANDQSNRSRQLSLVNSWMVIWNIKIKCYILVGIHWFVGLLSNEN